MSVNGVSVRTTWLIERNGEYYNGKGEFCSNPKHALQFITRLAALEFMQGTFIIAQDVQVVSRLLGPTLETYQ